MIRAAQKYNLISWIFIPVFFITSVNGASALLVCGMLSTAPHKFHLTYEHCQVHLVFEHCKKGGNGFSPNVGNLNSLAISEKFPAKFSADPNRILDHKFHLANYVPSVSLDTKLKVKAPPSSLQSFLAPPPSLSLPGNRKALFGLPWRHNTECLQHLFTVLLV